MRSFAPHRARASSITSATASIRRPCRRSAGFRILMICAQELPGAEHLAERARDEGLLLWMEDRREFCDFHLTAMLRRGDLTISVGTGGKCPGLARRLRVHLEGLFPPVWAEHLETLAAQRKRLRAGGATPKELIAATDQLIGERGWL